MIGIKFKEAILLMIRLIGMKFQIIFGSLINKEIMLTKKIEEEKAILEDEDSGVKITFDIEKKQIVEGKFDIYDKK